MIGWVAVIFAVQNWLSETPESAKSASTPGYMTVGMARMCFLPLFHSLQNPLSVDPLRLLTTSTVMSVAVTYLPLFMPPPAQMGMGSGTEAPAAAAVPNPS